MQMETLAELAALVEMRGITVGVAAQIFLQDAMSEPIQALEAEERQAEAVRAEEFCWMHNAAP